MPKKVLITGGSGFIGLHLTRHLLATEPETKITIVDNFFRGKDDDDLAGVLTDPRVALLRGDLTDSGFFSQLDAGYDQVYHLAAVNGTKLFYSMPQEVLRINTQSLINMLEWHRTKNPAGKFCFTSSNEAYAGGLNVFGQLPIPTPEAVPLVVEDPYNPRWTYAATKLIGECFVIHYAAQYGFRALIVRPHNFYGPRAGYDHVIPEFCQRIIARTDPFAIFGSKETRTFCYITDAVAAMALLMDSAKTDGSPVETVHIGAEDEITMRDLAEVLFSVSGWRPTTIAVKESPPGSVKRRRADISKIKSLVGWEPQTKLADGLKETLVWYQAHPRTK